MHGCTRPAHGIRRPATNLLDSGAHFYEVYATADGGHVAVGALEPQFYARLLELLEIPAAEMPQHDRSRWPEFKERLARVFAAGRRPLARAARRRGDCVTVVRGLFDAHDIRTSRPGDLRRVDGIRQPGPAPRFSRTPAQATSAGQDPAAALARWGLDQRSAAAVIAAAPDRS